MIERKDKIKNKATIAKEILKDPLATQKELEKRTGLGHWTVNRHIQELDWNGLSSDLIDRVLETDEKIMDLVAEVHYNDILKKVRAWTELTWQDHKILWDLANNSTKRKAIFGDTGEKKVNENITIQI